MMLGGYVDMTIPPPSVLSNYFDNDADYISDPDKVRDLLPQPYRLINKIVDFTFDIAWDEINKREEQRIADSLRIKPPLFECQVASNVSGARAMVSSCDGEFVFVGTISGIAVIKSVTGEIIDEYTDDAMIITSMSASNLDDGLHIVSTIDVQGIARLFLFNRDSIYLGKVLNESESSGPAANKVETSDDTDYIAVSLFNQNTGEAWIDFHKVPKDVWIKEASNLKEKTATHHKVEEPVFTTETIDSENPTPEVQDQDGTETAPQEQAPTHESKSKSSFRFSSTTLILKVKAPISLKPCTANSPYHAFKAVDSNSDLLATGQNHILSAVHLEARETVFTSKHKDLSQYAVEEEKEKLIPSIHFITATRYNPSGFDSGKPTSAVIWWRNRNQLMIYSLVKQAKDVNYRPDQIWPLSDRITASTVSPCTQLLAVGLGNGTVIIWDLFSCLQRRVYCVTPGRAIVQLAFMNPAVCPQEQPFQSHLPYQTQTSSYVLALSEDGRLNYCDTTMGVELTRAKYVLYDELDSRLEKFALLPGIPSMILGTFRDGNIYVIHALNSNFICQIVAPEGYRLDEDCLGTVAGRGQAILCKALDPEEPSEQTEEQEGEPEDSPPEEAAFEEHSEPKSTLFILQSLKFNILETYWSKEIPETPFVLHTTIEKRLDALMQQRFSQQPIRQARLQTAWQNMGSTLELILKKKEEEGRPKTAESRYAASTIVGSDGIPDSRIFGF